MALKGVDLAIKPGSKIAIMGPSGSGKSTLLQLIGGLDIPTSGEVIVGDREVHKLNDSALSEYRNKHIGFIFQTFNLQLFYTSVENVALPLILGGVAASEAKQKAAVALEQVGLGDKLDRLPSQLSGGEMQRVAIARALVNNPRVLLADEPTANLDRENAEKVLDLMSQLELVDQALVIVTHDDRVAAKFDRTVMIDHGEIKGEQ